MSIKASQISFNEGIIRLAKIHQRTIEFRYEKGPGKPIEVRRVSPTSITETRDEHMVFAGYDPDRDDARSFRVDRVKGDVKVL